VGKNKRIEIDDFAGGIEFPGLLDTTQQDVTKRIGTPEK